jgi:hypothetical protein
MAITSGDCSLWNKEGSDAEIDSSEIGNNGVRTGTVTYTPVKFDNGVSNNSGNNYVTFNHPFGNPADKGMIEFWFKTDFNVTNGVPSDGQFHHYWSFYNSGVLDFRLYHHPTAGLFMNHTDGFIQNNTIDWTAGDIIHGLCIWDKDAGFDGSKTMSLYIGGAEIGSATSTLTSRDYGTTITTLCANPTQFGGTLYPLDGAMDNIEMYPDPTKYLDVLANKDNESFIPDVPININATDGTSFVHTTISWNAAIYASTYNVYRATSEFGVYATITTGEAGLSYDDTTGTAGVVYWYKVTAVNGSGESDLSSADSGYKKIPVVPQTIIPVECTTKQPKVFLLSEDIDLYADGKVKTLPPLLERKTFQKDKLISNEIRMVFKNHDDFLSTNNPKSLVANSDWLFGLFKIYNDDNIIIWDGIIKNIIRNHTKKTAAVVSVSKLYQLSRKIMSYQSPVYETPGTAVLNIFAQEGFIDFDKRSLQEAIALQTQNNCFIKCDIQTTDNMTFQHLIEKLGEYGVADVYSSDNKIYYKHFNASSVGVTSHIVLDDIVADMRGTITVDESPKDIINDYSIIHAESETPETDTDNNKVGLLSRNKYGIFSLPEFNGGIGQQILIKDSIAAIYIGESYIRRTHKNIATNPKPLTKLTFSVSDEWKDFITLQSYIKVTLIDEGWTDHLFETYQRNIDLNKNNISLVNYEVHS